MSSTGRQGKKRPGGCEADTYTDGAKQVHTAPERLLASLQQQRSCVTAAWQAELSWTVIISAASSHLTNYWNEKTKKSKIHITFIQGWFLNCFAI